jgi:peptide/nickel transport system ATP-binding protein
MTGTIETGPVEGRDLVEVRGLEMRFAMPTHFLSREKPVLHAVNGVDTAVCQGEAFCVVGESGCGKTTLGRIIMGLLAPSAGEVHFDGTRIDAMSERRRRPFRARMQMVFQNPYASLNPRRTVFDTLSEPLRHLSPQMRNGEVREAVEAVMVAVGADPKWGRRMPHEFSGGQRQRIAIARALVTDPEFVVADEPISALDVSIQAQILNLMTKAREERGLTYLFITHDLSVVQHFGDRVAVMYLGQIVELAGVEELFDNPRHPYTRLLLDAIPKLEGGSFERERKPGELPNPIKPPPGCPFAPRCSLADKRCRAERPALLPAGPAQVACFAVEEGRE